MVDLSEIDEPMRSAYTVRSERAVLKDYWVYEDDAYPHNESVLIAVKCYPPSEDGAIRKVEFFASAHPVRFLEVRCHKANGDVVTMTTGSGNLAEYIRMILPLLDMWGEAMFGITYEKAE